jgi:hypothetical protein
MEDEFGPVECAEHGPQQSTFVCQHVAASLGHRRSVGFWISDASEPRPNAWCTECERVVQARGGEWDDESEAFAGVTLLCGACYDEARALSQA